MSEPMAIRAGQVWMLKSAEICRSAHSAFVDEMADFCGKEQTIEIVGDDGRFYTIGCNYYWERGCLDRLVRDVTETTITPEPCPERVEIPRDTAITKQGIAKIGEQWLLKKWDELSEGAQFQMVEEMIPYLGKTQMIMGLGDDYFEIEDGEPDDDRYRFPYECLDCYAPSAPKMEAPVKAATEVLPIERRKRTIRPVESRYDVLYETEDGAGCVTVKLFIDHRRNIYRIASLAKDGKFIFDTAQQGNPKIWRTVLKAIEGAIEFAEREVG